jgi:hypothetical protein
LFFIDGEKACAPMRAPPALLSLMQQFVIAGLRVRATLGASFIVFPLGESFRQPQ